VAALLGEHFVAAHQQVGDFEVTNVDGRLDKNGGNVASYFCTPSGRVLHAVVGPVKADELLAEAQWVLDAYLPLTDKRLDEQAREMARAHYAEWGGSDSESWSQHQPRQNQFTAWQQPARPVPYARTQQANVRTQQANVRTQQQYARAQQQSRQQFPWRGGGSREQRIHMLLAARPMAPVTDVFEEVFEHILGQKVSKAAPNLMLADRQLTLAEKSGRPLLFIIHRGHDNAAGYDEWLSQVQMARRAKSPWVGLLEHYVVVLLPLKELPALSHRLDQPPFEAPNSGTPLFVVANCYGQQLEATTGYSSQDQLARAMARGSVDGFKHRSDDARKMREVLRWVAKIDKPLADELRELIADTQRDRVAAR